MFVAKTL